MIVLREYMISASDAHAQTKVLYEGKCDGQRKYVKKLIEDAIKQVRYNVSVWGTILYPEIVEELEAQGYKVIVETAGLNETGTKILW